MDFPCPQQVLSQTCLYPVFLEKEQQVRQVWGEADSAVATGTNGGCSGNSSTKGTELAVAQLTGAATIGVCFRCQDLRAKRALCLPRFTILMARQGADPWPLASSPPTP